LIAQQRSRLEAQRDADAAPSPWDAADAFQLAGERRLALPITADGENLTADIAGTTVTVDGTGPADDAVAVGAGDAVYVLRQGRQTKVTLRDFAAGASGDHGGGGLVRAPMHGKVLGIFVENGQSVARGQRLAIIEAMKMEHTLAAPIDGTVAEIAVAKDAQVGEGAKVMVIVPASGPSS
jgi:3-methylcrotonyl-CoA carboxylase alpha subunit